MYVPFMRLFVQVGDLFLADFYYVEKGVWYARLRVVTYCESD
jgi:hypothetical protein